MIEKKIFRDRTYARIFAKEGVNDASVHKCCEIAANRMSKFIDRMVAEMTKEESHRKILGAWSQILLQSVFS